MSRFVPDKLPEDVESERSLLSTICAPGAEKQAWECVMTLRREDFVVPSHQSIFSVLMKVLDQNKEVEYQLLADALRQSGEIGRIGGFSGMMDILGAAEVRKPMALVEILQNHRRRRQLIRLGNNVMNRAQDDSETAEAIIQEAGTMLASIARHREKGGITHVSEFSDDAFADLTDEFNGHRGKSTWIKGWSRLNKMTGGFKPGQLIILAARPGIGKSSIALNWMLGATEYNKTAGLFSLEMKRGELWRRLVSAHAGVDVKGMIENRDRMEYQRVAMAKQELDQRGIWIEDRSSLTPQEILVETAALIAKSHNLGLLIVDYLGLVSSGDKVKASKQSETNRIGDLTRGFKLLAGENDVPLLLLCQMNREIEKSNRKPVLSDLRDSGNIEQDADMVMFIHRKMSTIQDSGAELIIAKQRSGPIGIIPLKFTPETTRYEETEQNTGFGDTPWYEPHEPSLEIGE